MIARANHRISYPARFQLVAAMNPCKCGMAGEPGFTCARGPRCRSDYQARVSGPLLDRIDLRIDVAALKPSDLILTGQAECSAAVAQRVAQARQRQQERYQQLGMAHIMTNAACPPNILEEIAAVSNDGRKLLYDVSEKLRLSARSYHRVLKVARTLADLEAFASVERRHIAEAVSYRMSAEMLSV